VSYWIGIEKLAGEPKTAALFPEYTDSLKAALQDSAHAFLTDAVSSGTLWDLFTSRKMYVNGEISTAFGIPGGSGTTLSLVTTTLPERSAGILTHPATIAANHERPARKDPIHMGLFVLNGILCGGDLGFNPIGDPPANAGAIAATMKGTEREQAAQRAKVSCGACHKSFDGMGELYYAYSSIGAYSLTRSIEQSPVDGTPEWTQSAPLDESGEIPAGVGADVSGTAANIREYAKKLASDGSKWRVAHCGGRWISKFVLSHDATAENSCDLKKAKDNFAKTGSFVEFFRDLATSPSFLKRKNPG
jgi:hypothetical protein